MMALTERTFRHALRRRRGHVEWDNIAAEIGAAVTGAELQVAVMARQMRDAGARKVLADRPRCVLPSIAIGRSADEGMPHQIRGAMARRIGGLRRAARDPLDNLIHPSAFRS
jgi:hypothetical protein